MTVKKQYLAIRSLPGAGQRAIVVRTLAETGHTQGFACSQKANCNASSLESSQEVKKTKSKWFMINSFEHTSKYPRYTAARQLFHRATFRTARPRRAKVNDLPCFELDKAIRVILSLPKTPSSLRANGF
jgi:hypothetical protein